MKRQHPKSYLLNQRQPLSQHMLRLHQFRQHLLRQ